MKIPVRLENAVTKLYNAFHKGKLDAGDCAMCAVGSLCNNNIDWSAFTGWSTAMGVLRNEYDEDALESIKSTGYNPFEVITIEKVFLNGMGYHSYYSIPLIQTKETQFKGLCAVVEYLCELDNVPNVMDIKSLFEYENDKHKYELNEIL